MSAPVTVGVLGLDSLVAGMFAPLSLLYFVAVSGQPFARIGVVLTIAGALSLPIPLWVGRLVDTHGPKRLVVLAQLFQATGFASYLLADTTGLILAAALVASVGQRIYWSSVYTLASDVAAPGSGPRARERSFGVIATVRAAGYGVGTIVSGIAVAGDPRGLGRIIVAISAVLLAAAALAVSVLVRPHRQADASQPVPGGYRVLWHDRGYLALIAVNILFCTCNVMLSIALAPTITRALPSLTFLVGPLLALNTIVQAISQVMVVRLAAKISRKRALAVAAVLWASWALIVAVALHTPGHIAVVLLVASLLCYSFAQLFHSPLMNALSVDAARPDLRGRYLAVFPYAMATASVIAPGLFGVLFSVANELPWIAVAAVAVATIPLIAILTPRLPALNVESPGQRAR